MNTLLKALIFCLIPGLIYADPQVTTKPASKPQKSIHIVCDDWRHLCEKNGSGLYLELLSKIYSAHGFTIKFSTEPFKRALISVSQAKYDMMPGALNTPQRAINLLYSDTRTSTEFVSLLYKKSNNDIPPTNIKGLTAKIRGYDYSRYKTQGIKFIEITNASQAIEMLLQNRVDYFMNDYFDSLTALNNYPETKSQFSLKIFTRDPIYTIFPKNPKGEQLKTIYEEEIRKLYNNGSLLQLTKKYSLPDIYAYYPELNQNTDSLTQPSKATPQNY